MVEHEKKTVEKNLIESYDSQRRRKVRSVLNYKILQA